MIVTHSNKFLTPKSKVVGGIRSERLDIPDALISSNCVTDSKKFWANPHSAAYYKEAIEVAKQANLDGKADNFFPDFVDVHTKQLFFKTKDGDYIVHSPLTSCALVDEFNVKARAFHRDLINKYLERKETRAKNKYIKHKKLKFIGSGYFNHQIQPKGVTLGNRGELATKHGGIFFVKSFIFASDFRGTSKVTLDESKQYLYFYGSVDTANFNSGFISAGSPALTAIGGMIESVELKLGYEQPIPFAFGLKNRHLSRGGKLGSAKGSGKTATPLLVMEEKTGSLDFVIVLDVTDVNSEHVANELMKVRRLAGGPIFNYKITNEKLEDENDYLFIRNLKSKMQWAVKSGDVINYLITNRLHPLACGYALLETPSFKKGVRVDAVNNRKYKHSFSETLFIPVRLSKRLNKYSFFKRHVYDNCTVYY